MDDHNERMAEHRRREHDAARFSPQAWLIEAERNLAGAILLAEPWLRRHDDPRRNVTLPPPRAAWRHWLLLGLAFECLLKAELARRAAAAGKLLRIPIKSHDLVMLARAAELDLLDEATLHALTREVEWRARYPMPVRDDELDGLSRLGRADWVRLGVQFQSCADRVVAAVNTDAKSNVAERPRIDVLDLRRQVLAELGLSA